MEIDMDIEFSGRCYLGEPAKRNVCRLSATKPVGDFAIALSTITHIDQRFVNLRARIAKRAENATPIRIATAPTRLYERAVRDSACSCLRISRGARAANIQRDETGYAFAVPHNHFS